jgi:single-strand DNA-binding protein
MAAGSPLWSKYTDMKSMNNVQLIGWLGSDPQISTTASGQLYAHLRLATDHWQKKPDGGSQKLTSWHTIRVWNQAQIEQFRHYLVKGSHILVDGHIIYRSYQDRSGQTQTVTEIKAHYLVDLDR